MTLPRVQKQSCKPRRTEAGIRRDAGRHRTRLVTDGKGDIRALRVDWRVHYLQHKIIPRYCDKVFQAETSTAPAHVRKVIFFEALHDANTIDESDDIEKKTTDDE